MNCPNCGSKVLEGDRFCGECGQDLVANPPVTKEKEAQSEPVHKAEEAPVQQVSKEEVPPQQSIQEENTNNFFKDMWTFVKDSFKSPTRTVVTANNYHVGVTIATLSAFIFINALVFTMMLSSTYSNISGFVQNYIQFPFVSVLIRLFIVVLLYILGLYGVGLALSKMFIRNVNAKQLLNQYAATFMISLSLHIISIIFMFIGSIQLYSFFMLLSLLVLVFVPIYVFFVNSENQTLSLDKLYIAILHFLAIAIGLLIVTLLSAEIIADVLTDFIFNLESVFDPFDY